MYFKFEDSKFIRRNRNVKKKIVIILGIKWNKFIRINRYNIKSKNKEYWFNLINWSIFYKFNINSY